MKVSELSGALLDYWVCRADGLKVIVAMRENCLDTQPSCLEVNERGVRVLRHSPSETSNQAGWRMVKARIGFTTGFREGEWCAAVELKAETYCDGGVLGGEHMHSGPTPLIAAMRCYVASQFGEEVAGEAPQA
jgi:hypothetical protein